MSVVAKFIRDASEYLGNNNPGSEELIQLKFPPQGISQAEYFDWLDNYWKVINKIFVEILKISYKMIEKLNQMFIDSRPSEKETILDILEVAKMKNLAEGYKFVEKYNLILCHSEITQRPDEYFKTYRYKLDFGKLEEPIKTEIAILTNQRVSHEYKYLLAQEKLPTLNISPDQYKYYTNVTVRELNDYVYEGGYLNFAQYFHQFPYSAFPNGLSVKEICEKINYKYPENAQPINVLKELGKKCNLIIISRVTAQTGKLMYYHSPPYVSNLVIQQQYVSLLDTKRVLLNNLIWGATPGIKTQQGYTIPNSGYPPRAKTRIPVESYEEASYPEFYSEEDSTSANPAFHNINPQIYKLSEAISLAREEQDKIFLGSINAEAIHKYSPIQIEDPATLKDPILCELFDCPKFQMVAEKLLPVNFYDNDKPYIVLIHQHKDNFIPFTHLANKNIVFARFWDIPTASDLARLLNQQLHGNERQIPIVDKDVFVPSLFQNIKIPKLSNKITPESKIPADLGTISKHFNRQTLESANPGNTYKEILSKTSITREIWKNKVLPLFNTYQKPNNMLAKKIFDKATKLIAFQYIEDEMINFIDLDAITLDNDVKTFIEQKISAANELFLLAQRIEKNNM